MTSEIRKIFGTVLLVSLVACATAETLHGRVVGVSDGDTISILVAPRSKHTIRLAGIDAPEKHQAFGQQSKQSLSDLVFGREVTVETTKKDRYGRKVGKVVVDGLDANLVQIKRGLAWHYKAYEHEQPPEDRSTYGLEEENARRERRGLWKDDRPIPPWTYRRNG